MAETATLRTDAGDEQLDWSELEARVRRGEISPQSLVRFEALTGDRFVPACELEVYRQLDSQRAHFTRAFAIKRFPYLTSALIVLNVVVYLLTTHGLHLGVDDMVRAGAKVAPLVLDLGELWRLFTANFLHWDAVHLGLNMFVLFHAGGVLENTYRLLEYVFLLVFAGVATMATSLLWNNAITAGASGMVFGCLGGIVAFGLKYRGALSSRYRSILGNAAIPTVLGFLLIGLRSPGVDNWAHVGGLMAGMLAGAFLRPALLTQPTRALWRSALRLTPSLALLLPLVAGHWLWKSTPLPNLVHVRDDVFGVELAVPRGWLRGADPLGALAYYNGLVNAGRASIAAESVDMPEGADVQSVAARFVDETLHPRKLGDEVLDVRAEAPEVARVADRDCLRVRARIDTLGGPTRLVAYFVPRGMSVVQLVLTWSDEVPEYGPLLEHLVGRFRLDEPRALRQARAQVLLFPNSPAPLARLGGALFDVGELTPSVEALAAAVRGDPSNVRYRAALARAALAAGEVERGCEAAKAALAYDPAHAQALEAAARCELTHGRPQRALDYLVKARQAEPGDERLKQAEQRLRAALEGP